MRGSKGASEPRAASVESAPVASAERKRTSASNKAAKALAVKHVAYGVTAAHYKPVGEALIWTLEQGLGPDFTPEVKDAWLSAYGALSGVMIAEAYGKEVAA